MNDKQVQELEAAIKLLEAENKRLKKQSTKQALIIEHLQKLLFGKKRDNQLTPGQLSMFDDDTMSELQEAEPEAQAVTVASHRRVRKVKPTQVREDFLDSLPQVEEVHRLSPEQKACPHCGDQMQVIGRHQAYREVDLKPARLYCRVVFTETAKCNHCENENGGDVLVQAPTPQPLFPHSYLSSSVLTEAIINKFVLAVPTHRQRYLWSRVKLPVTGKSLSRAIIQAAERFGKPIYNYLREELRRSPTIHMDETPFQVLDSKKQRCHFWAACTPKEFSAHQVTYFHYAATRSGSTLSEILGADYAGNIMCDGFEGYNQKWLPQVTYGTCLVHIARNFKNLLGSRVINPGKTQSQIIKIVHELGKIFDTEKNLHYTSAAEKLAQRQAKLRPLVDNFYQTLEEIRQKHPLKPLRTAIQHALHLKERVYKIFADGTMPIHNNRDEQLIRPTTIVRKNCLFARTTAGAKANAIWYSLIQTAKLNGLDPYKYLLAILNAFTKREPFEVEAYLPWAERIQVTCRN